MSGHSHWKTIKFKKAAADIQKSKVMSKLLNEVSVSARAGADPQTNYRLRAAIDKAKEYKVGVDVIDRAIKRGAGLTKEAAPEEIYYEAYGPSGTAIVIKAITDSRNRTVNEVKNILGKYNAKFAESGSVKWLFEEKGVITIPKAESTEELLLELIERGVENYSEQDDEMLLVMDYKSVSKVKVFLDSKKIAVGDSGIELIAKNYIAISEEVKKQMEPLLDALTDLDDIDDVYTNYK